LAFSVFALLVWTYLQLTVPRLTGTQPGFKLLRLSLFFTIVQIIAGALVAGNDAGLSYNTYPLMDGKFIPGGLNALAPWWRNHLSNLVMVQWQHRMLALLVVLSCLSMIAVSWRKASADGKRWRVYLLLVLGAQFSLGVATLLSVVQPIIASMHQLCALALLTTLLQLMYRRV
jgi:cytochrome c oxidase assembly protein subunit 15